MSVEKKLTKQEESEMFTTWKLRYPNGTLDDFYAHRTKVLDRFASKNLSDQSPRGTTTSSFSQSASSVT